MTDWYGSAAAGGRRTGAIRVLLVGDSPALERIGEALAADDRLAVSVERAPGDALEALAGQRVDCVVADHDPPGTDGLELLEAVRETRPTLPFVLAPADGDERVAARAVSAGASEYLRSESIRGNEDALGDRIAGLVADDCAARRADRWRRAIETADEAIALLDGDGRFVDATSAYADLFGYDPEEILGERWSRAVGRDGDGSEREGEGKVLARAAEGGWSGPTTATRPDGSTVVADHSIAPTDDGFVCLAWPVQVGDGRRPSAREKAVDAAPIGIVITDYAEPDNPIVYANERFQRLTGYDRSEILGRNCRFLQGTGTDPEPVAELREAIADERSATVVLRNYRADGAPFWNRVTVAPVRDESGTTTHFVGFQEDVSESYGAERELRRRDEQFERFGEVLSHDLTNPLNVAQGRLELAADTGDADHLDRARAALDRLEDLIDDLSDVMREGRLTNDPEPVDLAEVARAAWAGARTGDATLDLADAATVMADEKALTRMFDNLLRNAIEHCGEDVTVRVGALPDREGFYVEDDGPGIPPGERERIFEPGYTTKDGGTGFGLASIHQIALAHGWGIEATESADGGVRFEVTGVDVLDR